VKIKLEMDSVDIHLGNKGINLKIADPQGNHLGDLRIGRGHVVWMKGKTTEANGKKLTMKKFLDALDAM
jgi:hypothetical protein